MAEHKFVAATPTERPSIASAPVVSHSIAASKIKWTALYNVQHFVQLKASHRNDLLRILYAGATTDDPGQESAFRASFVELLNVDAAPTAAQLKFTGAMIVYTHIGIVQNIIGKLIENAYACSAYSKLRTELHKPGPWRTFLEAVVHFGAIVSMPHASTLDLLDAEGPNNINCVQHAFYYYPLDADVEWSGDGVETAALSNLLDATQKLCADAVALRTVSPGFERYLLNNVFIDGKQNQNDVLAHALGLVADMRSAVQESATVHYQMFRLTNTYLKNIQPDRRIRLLAAMLHIHTTKEMEFVKQIAAVWDTLPSSIARAQPESVSLHQHMMLQFVPATLAQQAVSALAATVVTAPVLHTLISQIAKQLELHEKLVPDAVSMLDAMTVDYLSGQQHQRYLSITNNSALQHVYASAAVPVKSLAEAVSEFKSQTMARRSAVVYVNHQTARTQWQMRERQSAVLLQLLRNGACDTSAITSALKLSSQFRDFYEGLTFLSYEDYRAGYYVAGNDANLQALMQDYGLVWLPDMDVGSDVSSFELKPAEMRPIDYAQNDPVGVNQQLRMATLRMLEILIADANKTMLPDEKSRADEKILPLSQWRVNTTGGTSALAVLISNVRAAESSYDYASDHQVFFRELDAAVKSLTRPSEVLFGVQITEQAILHAGAVTSAKQYYEEISQNADLVYSTMTFMCMAMNIVLTYFIMKYTEMDKRVEDLRASNANFYAYVHRSVQRAVHQRYYWPNMVADYPSIPMDVRPDVELNQLVRYLLQVRHALSLYKERWALQHPFERGRHLLCTPRGTALIHTSCNLLGVSVKALASSALSMPDPKQTFIGFSQPEDPNVKADVVVMPSLKSGLSSAPLTEVLKCAPNEDITNFLRTGKYSTLHNVMTKTITAAGLTTEQATDPLNYISRVTCRLATMQNVQQQYGAYINKDEFDFDAISTAISSVPALTQKADTSRSELQKIADRVVAIDKILRSADDLLEKALETGIARRTDILEKHTLTQVLHKEYNPLHVAAAHLVPQTSRPIISGTAQAAVTTLTCHLPVITHAVTPLSRALTEAVGSDVAAGFVTAAKPAAFAAQSIAQSNLAIGGLTALHVIHILNGLRNPPAAPNDASFILPSFSTIPSEVVDENLLASILPSGTTATWEVLSGVLNYVAKSSFTLYGLTYASVFVHDKVIATAPAALNFVGTFWVQIIVIFVVMALLLTMYEGLSGRLNSRARHLIQKFQASGRMGVFAGESDFTMSGQLRNITLPPHIVAAARGSQRTAARSCVIV